MGGDDERAARGLSDRRPSRRARSPDRDLRSARRAARAACRAGTAGQAPAGATGRPKGPCRLRRAGVEARGRQATSASRPAAISARRRSSSVAAASASCRLPRSVSWKSSVRWVSKVVRSLATVPRSAGISPASRASSVDFPAPLEPIKASFSPEFKAERHVVDDQGVRAIAGRHIRQPECQAEGACHTVLAHCVIRQPRSDALGGQQRAAEFEGTAAQGAEGLDGGEGDQDAERGDRRGDRAGAGERCNSQQRAGEQHRRGGPEAEGDARLDAAETVVGIGAIAVGGSDMDAACASSRPAISRSVWPATRSMVRARIASTP
jgi:hypothetical protein